MNIENLRGAYLAFTGKPSGDLTRPEMMIHLGDEAFDRTVAERYWAIKEEKADTYLSVVDEYGGWNHGNVWLAGGHRPPYPDASAFDVRLLAVQP